MKSQNKKIKNFFVEFDEETKKTSGAVVLHDLIMPFTVSARNRHGDHRIRMHIVSPQTDKLMMYSGTERKKRIQKLSDEELERLKNGQQVEKLVIEAEKIIKSRKKKDIQTGAIDLAQKLYTKNKGQIEAERGVGINYGQITADTAAYLYGEKFLAMQRISESTRREKQNVLTALCSEFGTCPIGDITIENIEELYQKVKSKRTWKFNLLNSFFAYCLEKKLYFGENPVEKFLHLYGHGRSGEEQAIRDSNQAKKSRRIPLDLERKLYDILIRDIHIEEKRDYAAATTIVKDGNFDLSSVVDMKLNNILLTSNMGVRIQDFKDYGGGTSNFTRPLLPAGEKLVRMYFDEIAKEKDVAEDKLNERYLIRNDRLPGKPVSVSSLSTYIRNVLREAGITGCLGNMNSKAVNEAGGAGVRMLKDHYATILRDSCGVDLDSPVGRFLQGQRLYDVSADHYCSYISKPGQWQLYGLVRRDDHLLENAAYYNYINSEKSSGKTKITIPSHNVSYLTGAMLEVYLPKGAELRIEAPYGVSGLICAHTPCAGKDSK